MSVYVLDKFGKPLMPCSEKRARLLLERNRARIHRLIPMVIRLVDREVADCEIQPLRIKIDPGSKFTGMAVVRETESVDMETGEINKVASVINLMQLQHRGSQISETLIARSAARRRRRTKNLRYRAPRFLNRARRSGWLPPSLQHRVDTCKSWVSRIEKWAPITTLSTELVRFDMQKMENPEISGIEYQQGALVGYEVREYLLEKWNRTCAYCGATGVALEIEHIHPKSRGGSNRISNLTLACRPCNQKKGSKPINEFLAHDPVRLKRIQSQAKKPLKDAAAVNSTRNALVRALRDTGLPIELGSGGRTKYNRIRLGIKKTHALDAVCVGQVDCVVGWKRPTLNIKCTGRGSYSRTTMNRYGFPRGYLMRQKRVMGFASGDLVRAVVPTKSKKVGSYIGKVAIRKSGSFNIQTATDKIQGISYKYCRLLQRADGYSYAMVVE